MAASAHALVSPSSSTQTFALFDSQWSVRSEPKFSAEWSAVTVAARLANVYLYYRYNTGVPRTGCQRAHKELFMRARGPSLKTHLYPRPYFSSKYVYA